MARKAFTVDAVLDRVSISTIIQFRWRIFM